MLSQGSYETRASEEELAEDLSVPSISSPKMSENICPSLSPDIAENSKVPNSDFHVSGELSTSHLSSEVTESAATSVTAIKTSVIYSSHLLNRYVPSKDSVRSSVPLKSSYNSHEQDTVANGNLKHSHAHLEPSDDEPEKKKLKTMCLDIAGPSRNPSYDYCYTLKGFKCEINNAKLLRESTVIMTNTKKLKRLSTEMNSSSACSQPNTKSIVLDHVDPGSLEVTANSSCSSAKSLVVKIRVIDGVINYISSCEIQNSDHLKSEINLVIHDSDDEASNSNSCDDSYSNSFDDSNSYSFDDSNNNSFDDSNSNSFDDSNSNSFDDSNSNSFDDSNSNSFDDSKSNSFDDSNRNPFDDSNKCHEDNPEENYFDRLPFGITEQIFCKLPFLDLMRSRCVCKSWNDIIGNPKYLDWKKAYYDLKSGHNESPRWIKTFPYFNTNVASVKNCFSALIRFMAKNFLRKPPSGLKTFLSQIPSCVTAENVLLERFSEHPLLYTHPWCILTITILLSSTVEDLYEVFNYLLNVCLCDYEDMLEAMFCIATILWHFMKTFNINHGLHYRLYSVIYLFENGFSTETAFLTANSQVQEIYLREQNEEPVVRKMTYEQISILNHTLAPNQRVKIISHAGAGKTSTLVQFARKHSNLKFLYISEVICDDMLEFSPNIVFKTANLMAYEAVGKLYSEKLTTKMKPFDILPFVHRWKIFFHGLFCYGKCILLTIENFIRSADEHFSKDHVPKSSCSAALQVKMTLYNQSEPYDNGDLLRLVILNESIELWEKMISLDNEVKITKDIYLKLFQLTHPMFEGYDCIMVDETEDFSAAMLDVILSQNVPVILAGDPNQQINELRGTISPWLNLDASHTYFLTKSFRFGPEIAYVGSCCLEVFKRNTPTLVGSSKPSNIDGIIKGQYAIITRTNETLFLEALRMCCTEERKPHEPMHFRGAFVGGMSTYGFEQLADIYRLKTEGPSSDIKDPFIKKFHSFILLSQYVILAEDRNMSVRLNLVEEYGAAIEECIARMELVCSYELVEADVVFSTAQNVKGLEFDTVGLTNDYQLGTVVKRFNHRVEYFESLHITPTEGCLMEGEEQNLIYVAATRAKKCLIMSEKLYSILLAAQEKFEYPVVSATIPNNSTSLKCASCSNTFIPHTLLTMVRQPLTMKSGRKPWSGPLCISCATNPQYSGVAMLREEFDHAHASMVDFVGPLPNEDPIVHEASYHI